jgi:hypothetical protein
MQTGLPIAGYLPQTEVAIELVNTNKELEEQVLRRLDALGHGVDVDKRWLAISRTAIEQGFMAMNRAIFKPVRFALPGD